VAAGPFRRYTGAVTRALSLAIFLVIAVSLLGGMHWYLWLRLVRDPALADPWRRLLSVALIVLTFSVPIGMLALRLAPRPLDRIIPVAAFTWLGVGFLLFVAVLALDLARLAAEGATLLADYLRARPEPPADPARRVFVARALAGTAAVATAGVSAYAFRKATGPAEVSEVPVRLERLPPALSGLTIAQISDLHVGPTIVARDVRRIVDQVNGLRPDVVAITGDLVDEGVGALRAAVSHVGDLRARYGVYFVTGNHEYYVPSERPGSLGASEWMEELRRLGVRVLRNERVTIGDAGASLDLAGVDDYSAPGPGHAANLAKAVAGRDPDRSLVLLAHQPRTGAVADSVRSGVELQISGHTHGGQIAPWNLVVAAVFPYVKGLYRHEEDGRAGQVFVSRGTGYWGPPLRLGAPPEIAKLVLTR
jgi:predicted MPP superfamily phosphohydrolase